MTDFDSEKFLPQALVDRITEIRVEQPDRAFQAAGERPRRPQLAPTGRLSVIAADHPARRATRAGDDPLAMADRRDLLARAVRILCRDAADGILASMDVLEELLILNDLQRQAGGQPFLDNKLLIASLNRGGLAGVSWELDDAWTGPDADACAAWNLDGAKALLRIVDDDDGSLRTLKMCAEASRQLQARNVPFFLEPLPQVRRNDQLKLLREAEPIAKAVGVAVALGNGARGVWLKLPACPQFEIVAKSTTLPIVILGGEVEGDRSGFFRQIETALASGANVRGTMIGRNVLYPPEGDPLGPALAVQAMVHHGQSADDAVALMHQAAEHPLEVLEAGSCS